MLNPLKHDENSQIQQAVKNRLQQQVSVQRSHHLHKHRFFCVSDDSLGFKLCLNTFLF